MYCLKSLAGVSYLPASRDQEILSSATVTIVRYRQTQWYRILVRWTFLWTLRCLVFCLLW